MLKIINENIYLIAEIEVFTVNNQQIVLSHQKIEKSEKLRPKLLEDDGSSQLIPLHNGSRVYINKNDILGIFSNKPALYTVRLIELVYGLNVLKRATLPDERENGLSPLESESFDSILSELSNI